MCLVKFHRLLLNGLEKNTIHFSTFGTFQTGLGKSSLPCLLLVTPDQLVVVHRNQDQLLHCFNIHRHTASITTGNTPNNASLIVTGLGDQQHPSLLPGAQFHSPQQASQLHESQTSLCEREPAAVLLLEAHHAHTLNHFFRILSRQKTHPDWHFTVL